MRDAQPLLIVRHLVGGPFAGDTMPLPPEQQAVIVHEPSPGWLILSITGEGREVGRYVRAAGGDFRWLGPERWNARPST